MKDKMIPDEGSDQRLPNVFAEAPAGTIPIFSSLEAFGDYMFAMREQYAREHKGGRI